MHSKEAHIRSEYVLLNSSSYGKVTALFLRINIPFLREADVADIYIPSFCPSVKPSEYYSSKQHFNVGVKKSFAPVLRWRIASLLCKQKVNPHFQIVPKFHVIR